MNLQSIRQRARPLASAGLLVFTLVSSAVIARVSEAPEAHAHAQPDNKLVQDKDVEASLDYKLFLHRQARLVASQEGASR